MSTVPDDYGCAAAFDTACLIIVVVVVVVAVDQSRDAKKLICIVYLLLVNGTQSTKIREQ